MKFRVLAIAGGGATRHMEVDALDQASARQVATRLGLVVVKVSPASRLSWAMPAPRVHLQTTILAQEIVALLEAGLTITEAISALAERESSSAIRETLQAVADSMSRGATFSEALESTGNDAFPRLLIASARSSERSGGLADALRRYSEYAAAAESLAATVRSSMVYPGLLLGMGGLVILFLLGFVVPKFSDVYREAGRDLPALSKALLAWGSFATAHWPAVISGAIAALAGLVGLARHALRSGAAKRALLAVPAIARQVSALEHIRLYRALALLLRAGIPLAQALDECLAAVPASLAPGVRKAGESLRLGHRLSDVLETQQLASGIALRLVRAGERGAGLPDMLERAAAFEEQRLSRAISTFTRLLEPVLMAVLGVLIGGIVVLMYLPIFDLASAIE